MGARKLLIQKGISNVKIEPLAKTLKVTPGSFYWHFSGREALYNLLLSDWIDTNTAPLHKAVEAAGSDPRQQYLAFFGVWVLERDFDPAYDSAIRDWARISKKVARTLRQIDNDRIELLIRIFENFGYQGIEAEMRARVTYYHQVGYYAMNVREKRGTRLELAPYYAEILTGSRWLHTLGSAEEIREGMAGRLRLEKERQDEPSTETGLSDWPDRVQLAPKT
ncbi:MAG: TetR/AcrR family transcriptional regulator [Hyphomicrobiales bacterium]|nr:TetR/AcrR family transcriptional regulator [Hyphomicrobiales bacterium]